MKKYLSLIVLLLSVSMAFAQNNKMIVHQTDGKTESIQLTDVQDVRFSENNAFFYMNESEKNFHLAIQSIDSLTFYEEVVLPPDGEYVIIRFVDGDVVVENPFEAEVEVTVVGNMVSVVSTAEDIVYYVQGTTEDGAIDFACSSEFVVYLDNVNLTCTTTPVINLSNKNAPATFVLVGNNKLSDSITNTKKNVLASKSDIAFEGNGSLEVLVNKSNGISSDYALTVNGGTINVSTAIEDGKAMKADGDFTINGGSLDLVASGKQSKGISAKANLIINGGSLSIIASGTTALEELGSGYDTSYCSAIKCSGNVIINGGTIDVELTSTNNGGKGVSADGNITIKGGNITISTAGTGEVYTDENGAKDSYTSSCLKSDADIYLLGGTITCLSSGGGGKGVSADGILVIGNEEADKDDLVLNVTTSGERFYVSGYGDNADYANPKAIKSEGDLTVNSGTIIIRCTQSDEGGEGLESKATLTVNDGYIDIETYDDCINASNHIEISGGTVYCTSSGNDAIDSNGTLTISGGLIIANGTKSPEAGFDCDNNTFTINKGGIVIGTGGSTSNPTSNTSSQYSIKYNNATPGSHIALKNSSGDYILLFELPTYTGAGGNNPGGGPGGGGPGGNSMVVLFSDPNLTQGSYTLQYGGSITGGTTTYGYNVGGTYSGGSTKTVTITNKVTTVN